MSRVVALCLVALSLAACDDDQATKPRGPLAGTCGFPARTTDAGDIPPEFVLDDAEVGRVESTKKRLIASLYVPHDVQGALRLYRTAVNDAGYEIIRLDNEGFEAEIYLRKADDLAALQIRMSTCDDAVAVFVNVIRDVANRGLG
ncbi:MAG: hypothetical protein M3238_00960 [Actinomycetota bacterium]|nr:hypothetical protein [Actinomycetota bacterium]